MIAADGAVGVLLFGLWVFCIIDVITTPEPQIRNLPKLAWLFIVIVLVDLGSLAWLIAGRQWQGSGFARQPATTRFPEYERPGRHVAQNPDDDDAFLAQVRSRAEAQRRQYEERRRRELAAEDEALRKRPETDN